VAGGVAAPGSLGSRYVGICVTGSARGAASNGGLYRDPDTRAVVLRNQASLTVRGDHGAHGELL
jgi:hypothetical protein